MNLTLSNDVRYEWMDIPLTESEIKASPREKTGKEIAVLTL